MRKKRKYPAEDVDAYTYDWDEIDEDDEDENDKNLEAKYYVYGG